MGVALLVGTNAGAQGVIESRPGVVQAPRAEEMVDRFPTRVAFGQKAPWNAAFQDIQDRIDHPSAIGWWSATLFRFGQHRLEKFPLSVGEFSFVGSDIHRPNSGCAENVERQPNASCQCVFHHFRKLSHLANELVHVTVPGKTAFSDTLLTIAYDRDDLLGGDGQLTRHRRVAWPDDRRVAIRFKQRFNGMVRSPLRIE